MQAESFAERILFLLLERDRRVRDYCSQPAVAVVTWTDADGVTHRYVPDAIAWYWGGQVVVYEVTRSERRDLEKAIAGRTLTSDQIATLRKAVRHSLERQKEARLEYEEAWLGLRGPDRGNAPAGDGSSQPAHNSIAIVRRATPMRASPPWLWTVWPSIARVRWMRS